MAPKPTDVPKAYFTALFCEAIMHGIYTMLFCGAKYLLLWKTSWRKRTAVQKVLIFLTIFMYALSTVHLAISLRQSLVAFFEEGATNGGLTTFNDPGSGLLVSQTSLILVNCLLGDSIVVWRAWVLWGGGWKVLVFPITLLLAGSVTGSILVKTYASAPISATLYNNGVTLWLEVFGAVTFSCNAYAICIIGYKAWLHERTMKGIFSRGSAKQEYGGRFHRSVLIIIESGTIYCIVLLVVVAFIAVGNDFAVIVIVDVLAHLTGIYPSLILILISAKVSFSDQLQKETTLATIQFNNGIVNTNLNANHGSPRHIQTRESDTRLPFKKRTDTEGLNTLADWETIPIHPISKSAVQNVVHIPTRYSSSSSGKGIGDIEEFDMV